MGNMEESLTNYSIMEDIRKLKRDFERLGDDHSSEVLQAYVLGIVTGKGKPDLFNDVWKHIEPALPENLRNHEFRALFLAEDLTYRYLSKLEMYNSVFADERFA